MPKRGHNELPEESHSVVLIVSKLARSTKKILLNFTRQHSWNMSHLKMQGNALILLMNKIPHQCITSEGDGDSLRDQLVQLFVLVDLAIRVNLFCSYN